MKSKSNNSIKINELEQKLEDTRTQLATNSVLTSRLLLSRQIGDTAQKHNVWESAGYPKLISFENYWTMYKRGGVAKRVVDMFPDATWTKEPIVKEIQKDEKKSSEFNDKFFTIYDKLDLYNKLKRLDITAGIGEYSCLLLGFNDDGIPLTKPVGRATELSYIRVLPQKWCTISTYNNDPSNSRFGQPETYNINIDNGYTGQVHYTRVLHVVWESLESDYIGVPALESVFNYLLDLEKMGAAEGEGFWKWAFPGMLVKADANAKIDDPMKTAMKTQIDEYEANLRRTLTSQGFDIEQMKSIVASADKQIDTRLTLIAGTKGAPKRILIGNEQGELASSQDENSWNKKITERQNNFARPMIMRTLIDRLIEFGVLPKVEYEVWFPDVSAPSEKEVLENKEKLVKIAEIYKRAELEDTIPFYNFLVDFMGYSEQVATEIMNLYNKMQDDEDADFEEVE